MTTEQADATKRARRAQLEIDLEGVRMELEQAKDPEMIEQLQCEVTTLQLELDRMAAAEVGIE